MSYALLALGLLALPLVYLTWYMRWQQSRTAGDNYYALPLAGRRKLRRQMLVHARLLLPVTRLLLRITRAPRDIKSMSFQGITGPLPTCDEDSFRRTAQYRASARDVFVVSQMKAGTTWMQQIAYEIIMRGRGNLGDDGHRHLYAASPWIEAYSSVSMEQAPLLGEEKLRLIKTHMPVSLCPYDSEAHYLYIARDPVRCFSSTEDFFNHLLGPMAPARSTLLDWFCSDNMFWTAWPEHLADWWDLAEASENVCFVHYESLRNDTRNQLARIAEFLGWQPSESELDQLQFKTGFEYMRENEELFEMSPPNMFSVASDGGFIRRGDQRRDEELNAASIQRIREFCKQRLAGRSYPTSQFYPDLA